METKVRTIAEVKKCCACMACKNVCPKEAIDFISDKYGFLYPEIREEKCISCGKCVSVCRFSQEDIAAEYPQKCFAAVNKDLSVLKKSSSGGVFGALAELVLERGGYVFGAAYDDDLNVRHICVTNEEGLDKLHGSKYVQSNIGSSLSQAKDLLKDGKTVLFSGTPCQIDALKAVLDKTDTGNLITVDLICHGTPNETVFHKYLEYLGSKNGGRVVRYSFRSKARDWNTYCSDYDYQKENGTVQTVVLGRYDEFYTTEFLNGNLSREECFSCKYAAQKRVGDFTVGDFWGYQNGNIKLEYKNGLSVFTANTAKAVDLIEKLKDKLELQEVDYAFAVSGNAALRKAPTRGKRREHVLKLILDGKSQKVYREYRMRYYSQKIKKRIKALFKSH